MFWCQLVLEKIASLICSWFLHVRNSEGLVSFMQFVNFTEIMSKKVDLSRKQTEFALSALMEIPSQYKATLELGILG